MIAVLTDRSVIALSGEEAAAFLQGLITNDIAGIAARSPAYAALLTPQGKLWCDFLIYSQGDSLLLDCKAGLRDALVKRLAMYRLRAKVAIAARDDLAVYAAWDGALADAPEDPRAGGLGRRAVLPAPPDGVSGGDADYLAHRLALGIPETEDFGQGVLFALEAGLDALHAISFSKGCYVGQELTARMKHRAKAHKRLLPVAAEAPLRAGDAVMLDGESIGAVLSSYGDRGFALLRCAQAPGTIAASINNANARIEQPAWLFS